MSSANAVLEPVTAKDGTCVPLTDGLRIWAVRGRSGWYRCDLDRQACSCPDFRHRHSQELTTCRHLRALSNYLMAAALVRMEFAAAPEPTERMGRPMTDAELREVFA